MSRKTWIEISKTALISNVSVLKSRLSRECKFMAVVKANAYGHGIKEVASILDKTQSVDWYGVDSLFEGKKLRANGVTKPILILGYVPSEEVSDAIGADLDLTVYNFETIELIKKINKKARVHIKIETGTQRQGVQKENLDDFAKRIKEAENIIVVGVSTHFADLEDAAGASFAGDQLENFKTALSVLKKHGIKPEIRHAAPSAGILRLPVSHFDLVRAGISLYGYWPSLNTKIAANDVKLLPALAWKTIIAQIKNIPSGTPVGYGLTEKAGRKSRIALLPIGYYDGFDRGLSSIGEVLIGGMRCKVIGRVCMNMIMVDITRVPKVDLEAEAVIIGRQGAEEVTADEIAKKTNTIAYEVLARLNPLIPRLIL